MNVLKMMLYLWKNTRLPEPIMMKPAQDYFTEELRSDTRTLKQVAEEKNFYVGVAVPHRSNDSRKLDILDPERVEATIRTMVTEHFNSATPENVLKWGPMLKDRKGAYDEYDFTDGDYLMGLLAECGARVRGHTLVWGKFKNITYPNSIVDALKNAPDRQTKLKEIITQRIVTIMGRYKDRVRVWDVVNESMVYADEPVMDGIFWDEMGLDYIEHAFKVAHSVDPTAHLVMNETLGNLKGEKAKYFMRHLQTLLDKGTPIHGVGIQGHHFNAQIDLDGLLWYGEQLNKMGLKFELTEIDFGIQALRENPAPLQSQAELYYRWVRAAASQPNCVGITWWGMTDAYAWYDHTWPFKRHKPSHPYLLDEKIQPKPAYYAVRKALSEIDPKTEKWS